MAEGVIAASEPPAMATSTSPRRICPAAAATASSPPTQLFERVPIRAGMPIRCAIVLAAARWMHASTAEGSSRLGPCLATRRIWLSMWSNPPRLMPSWIEIGADCASRATSSPASFSAISAATSENCTLRLSRRALRRASR